MVKKKLLAEFAKKEKPEEEFNEATAAGLDVIDIRGSLARINALYKRLGFNETAFFFFFRKVAAIHPELAQFVIY